MFVSGSYLLSDASSTDVITLEDVSMFTNGDKVQILDMDDQESPFGEERTIIGIHVGNSQITLDTNITGSYTTTNNAYVGVLEQFGNPSYVAFYEPNLGFIRQLYDQAYVEFVFPKKGSGPVPNAGWSSAFCGTVDASDLYDFSGKWWHPDNRFTRNYFYLVGAERLCQGDLATLGGSRAWFDANTFANFTFIFADTIAASFSGDLYTRVVRITTVHELGHQFNISTTCTDPPATGHCTNDAYAPQTDSEACIMRQTLGEVGIDNDVVRFCLQHILTDSNTCWDDSIRTIEDNL